MKNEVNSFGVQAASVAVVIAFRYRAKQIREEKLKLPTGIACAEDPAGARYERRGG